MYNLFFLINKSSLKHFFFSFYSSFFRRMASYLFYGRKKTLLGICFYGMKQLPKEQTVNLPMPLKMRWLGIVAAIQCRNELMNNRCLELQKKLSSIGFDTCILKGQGIAAVYKDNLASLRQSGI